VREAWTEAAAIAKELGVGYVGTDMLLLGLTRTEGVAADVLATAGATEAAIAAIVMHTVRSDPPPTADADAGYARPTPAAEHARGRAEGLGIALGVADGSIRLLLALAYDRSGLHSSVLRHVGADRAKIVEALADRGVPVPPTSPAPDRMPFTVTVTLPDEQARAVAAELGRRSVADRTYWFDAWGGASWGYGGVPGRPADSRISGEARIRLREIVPEILAASGYPPPPDEAWNTREEA
jgi:Clp amino terminal domain, pathogenicity island component